MAKKAKKKEKILERQKYHFLFFAAAVTYCTKKNFYQFMDNRINLISDLKPVSVLIFNHTSVHITHVDHHKKLYYIGEKNPSLFSIYTQNSNCPNEMNE